MKNNFIFYLSFIVYASLIIFILFLLFHFPLLDISCFRAEIYSDFEEFP